MSYFGFNWKVDGTDVRMFSWFTTIAKVEQHLDFGGTVGFLLLP